MEKAKQMPNFLFFRLCINLESSGSSGYTGKGDDQCHFLDSPTKLPILDNDKRIAYTLLRASGLEAYLDQCTVSLQCPSSFIILPAPLMVTVRTKALACAVTLACAGLIGNLAGGASRMMTSLLG